jgi:hypothetical protein
MGPSPPAANKAMHTELAAVPSSLYYVTRANRVIASVRSQKEVSDAEALCGCCDSFTATLLRSFITYVATERSHGSCQHFDKAPSIRSPKEER